MPGVPPAAHASLPGPPRPTAQTPGPAGLPAGPSAGRTATLPDRGFPVRARWPTPRARTTSPDARRSPSLTVNCSAVFVPGRRRVAVSTSAPPGERSTSTTPRPGPQPRRLQPPQIRRRPTNVPAALDGAPARHGGAHEPVAPSELEDTSPPRWRPSTRTASCRPDRWRRYSVPLVAVPSGVKVNVSEAPKRTASAPAGRKPRLDIPGTPAAMPMATPGKRSPMRSNGASGASYPASDVPCPHAVAVFRLHTARTDSGRPPARTAIRRERTASPPAPGPTGPGPRDGVRRRRPCRRSNPVRIAGSASAAVVPTNNSTTLASTSEKPAARTDRSAQARPGPMIERVGCAPEAGLRDATDAGATDVGPASGSGGRDRPPAAAV